MKFSTPILFLIWNRPDRTRRVFEKIKEIKPRVLYIAADGPREGVESDIKNCIDTRKIVSKINWNCSVKKKYSDSNNGLKKSVSESISWFFNENSEGIILEDDCLPDVSFFNFCSAMLKRYRHNKKVMHVSGDNFQPLKFWNAKSYYFSKYPHIWGWATWRRAWKTYDVNISSWPQFKKSKNLYKTLNNYWERLFWATIFDAVFVNKINTWDYQWVLNVWRNNGVAINPGVNLVSNIGFGEGAVHTVSEKSKLSQIPTKRISIKLADKPVKINQLFDIYTSKNVFGVNPVRSLISYIYYRFKV